MATELDKYIEKQADELSSLTITDYASEEYLKEICEGYYKIKQGQALPKPFFSVGIIKTLS